MTRERTGKILEVITPDYLVELFSSDVFTELTREALRMVDRRYVSGFMGMRVINKLTMFIEPSRASYKNIGRALAKNMFEGKVRGGVPEYHPELNPEDNIFLLVHATFSQSNDGYPNLELPQNLIEHNREDWEVNVRPICICGSRYEGENRLAFYQQISDKPPFLNEPTDVFYLGAISAYSSGELARVLGDDTDKYMRRILGGEKDEVWFGRPDVKRKIEDYHKGEFLGHILTALRKKGIYKAELIRFGEEGIYKEDIDKVRQFSIEVRDTKVR